jgi:hypothetical protein
MLCKEEIIGLLTKLITPPLKTRVLYAEMTILKSMYKAKNTIEKMDKRMNRVFIFC